MSVEHLTGEELVVAEDDRDGPQHGQGNQARDSEEARVVANQDEHLHVMCQHVGLVAGEVDREEVLTLSTLVGYSVPVSVERNVEADHS